VLERAGDAQIDGVPAAERLLAPTRIYVKSVLALMKEVTVNGLAHITGGGITENIPRVLHGQLNVAIDTTSWEQGAVFDFLQQHGNIETAEMRRTFNCGVGMVVVVNPVHAPRAIDILHANGEHAWPLGTVIPGNQAVQYV
jgi:phosphoribosylformylglycinamidine cyclo-ligase